MTENAPALLLPDRPRAREIVSRTQAGLSPMELISVAVQQGADLAKIEKLMDLRDRWEATEARKAYVSAMAAFKAEPIAILKTKQVNIPGGAKFAHATLADVVDGVCSALSKHGLSHAWETSQGDGRITVTCVITHQLGHSERTTLSGAPDDSGRKNSIQQVASTVTYLERYTLMAACGLAAKDMDDDARGATGHAQANKPEGYDAWSADMEAKADEGTEAFRAAWKASKAEYRVFASAGKDGWMASLKSRAARADGAA